MLENLTTEQTAFVDKLVKERDDVIRKLEKLNAFLYKGESNKLSCDARCLLEEQKNVMERYVDVLNRRINCYIIDCTSPLSEGHYNVDC